MIRILLIAVLSFSSMKSFGNQVLRAMEQKVWHGPVQGFSALEKQLVRNIQDQPNQGESYYLLSHLYLRRVFQSFENMGLIQTAQKLSEQALALCKTDCGVVAALSFYDLVDDQIRYKQVLKEANQRFPQSWRVQFVNTIHQAKELPFVQVEQSIKQLLKHEDVDKKLVLPVVLSSYVGLADSAYALKRLRLLAPLAQSQKLHLIFAEIYEKSSQFSQAAMYYAKALKRGPLPIDKQLHFAIILYDHLNQAHKAQAILRDVVESSLATSEQKQKGFLHLGRLNLLAKRYKDAESYFSASLDKGKENLYLLEWIIEVYQKQKQEPSLASLLKRLTVEIPGQSYLYALQGEVLSDGMALHESALKAYEKALILNPSDGELFEALGLVYHSLGRLDLALQAIDMSIGLNRLDATAHYNRACLLSLQGSFDSTISSLERAIALDPELGKLAKTDGDFTKIRENQRFRFLVY